MSSAGKTLLSFFAILLISFVAAPTGAGAQSNVRVEKITKTIEKARDELQAGKYAASARSVTKVIEDSRTPASYLALAFFYRAVALRMQGRQVQSLSDFSNALWLQSLPNNVLAQVHFHRGHLFKSMGRTEEAKTEFAEASRLAPEEEAIQKAMAELDPGAGSKPILNSRKVQTQKVDADNIDKNPAQGQTLERASTPEQPVINPARPTREAAAPQIIVPDDEATGGITPPSRSVYAVQLGSLPSINKAHAEWQRLASRHHDVLSSLKPIFEEVEIEGRNHIRLRAGPLRSLSASRNLCRQLIARDERCIAVGR